MTLLLAQKLNLLGRLSELSVHIIEYIYINNNTHKREPRTEMKKCHLLNEILLLLHCTRVPKILFLLYIVKICVFFSFSHFGHIQFMLIFIFFLVYICLACKFVSRMFCKIYVRKRRVDDISHAGRLSIL